MAIKTINVQMTEAMEREIKRIAQYKGETFDDVVKLLCERAIKDMHYRTQRNAERWAQLKAAKERVTRIEAKAKELGIEIEE